MNHQIYESNFWKSITAVASGIMTSLLYDLVSQTSYVIKQEGTHYIIVSNVDSTNSTAFTFLFIFILFFSLWGIFSLFIYIGTNVFRQLRFRKRKRIDSRSLLEIFNSAKKQTIVLMNIIENLKEMKIDKMYAKLYVRDLAIIIISLHDKFCKRNLQGNVYSKNYFRSPNHASIVKISEGISSYELHALLELLNKLIHDMLIYSDDDELMIQDCNELLDYLTEMSTI